MTFYIYAILKKNNVYKNFILDVKNYFEYSGEKNMNDKINHLIKITGGYRILFLVTNYSIMYGMANRMDRYHKLYCNNINIYHYRV